MFSLTDVMIGKRFPVMLIDRLSEPVLNKWLRRSDDSKVDAVDTMDAIDTMDAVDTKGAY